MVNECRYGLYVTLKEKSVDFFSLLFEALERNGSAGGQKIWRGSGAVYGCGKIGWREREVAEGEAGVTEIGLSDDRKFCRSRSAHMLRCLSTEPRRSFVDSHFPSR